MFLFTKLTFFVNVIFPKLTVFVIVIFTLIYFRPISTYLTYTLAEVFLNCFVFLSTDEEKAARRKSYLKATWGNHSDLELSDSEPSPSSIRRK